MKNFRSTKNFGQKEKNWVKKRFGFESVFKNIGFESVFKNFGFESVFKNFGFKSVFSIQLWAQAFCFVLGPS